MWIERRGVREMRARGLFPADFLALQLVGHVWSVSLVVVNDIGIVMETAWLGEIEKKVS